MTVTIYGRAGCHLCDEAEAAVARVRAHAGVPFEVRKIDIAGDAALEKKYGVRIPVVYVDDERMFDFRVDKAELAARLESP